MRKDTRAVVLQSFPKFKTICRSMQLQLKCLLHCVGYSFLNRCSYELGLGILHMGVHRLALDDPEVSLPSPT
jgi:hypothetical protein